MANVVELVLRGDNRSALRALRQVDEAASKTQGKVEKSNKKTSASFGLVRSALGFVGVAAGADFVKNMVTGALSVQAAQTQAQNALRVTGQTATQQRTALARYNQEAEAASTHGGGTKAQELTGLAKLTQLTGDSSKAVQANAAANRLAVGANIDYQSAMQAVTAAEAGRFRGLQRYLPLVAPVKTAEQQLASAHGLNTVQIDAEAKAMGKAGPAWKQRQLLAAGITKAQQAQAMTADKNATAQKMLTMVSTRYGHSQESMKQKVQDVKHSFQNLTDNLGKALLPVITKAIGIAGDFARFLAKNKGVVIALGAAITMLGTGILAGKLMSGIRTAKAGFLDLGRAIGIFSAESEADIGAVGLSLDTVLVTTGIGAVLVALGLMATHWKETKKIAMQVINAISQAFTATWHAITSVFTTAFNFIKNHWQLILSILTGPIGAAIIWIVTHFKDVKHAVTGVVNFIAGIAKDVWNGLTWPFRKAFQFIKDGFNGVKHFLHGIPIIGGLFSHGGLVHMAHGGPVYRAVGGPSGSDTVPAWLTPGEFVMPRSAVQAIGTPALQHLATTHTSAAAQQPITIQPMPVIINLDSRRLAEGVAHFALKRAARGTSSTVGGPAIMGLGSA